MKEVKYWMFVTNEDNWKTIKNKKIYGFDDNSKKYINQLSNDDFVVMYIKGSKIGGLFKIKSLLSKSKLNFKYGNYPYKISLVKVLIPKRPIEIDKLVQNISIFQGMKRWGTILMGKAVKELDKKDYFYIKKELMNYFD